MRLATASAGDIATTAIGLPTRALGAVDEMLKVMRYRAVVSAKAAARAEELGLGEREAADFMERAVRAAFDPATGRGLDEAAVMSGMLGVSIIFVWGPPLPDFENESYLLLGGDEAPSDAEREANRRLRRRHLSLSKLGLALIFLGFLVQLVAVWLE